MRQTFVSLLILCMSLFGGMTHAAPLKPLVVVELFTSQGCPNCPPADELMRDLAEDAALLPLALHVDYWDYLGWKDVFARPEHTERQRDYVRASGKNMVYTPHFVLNGAAHFAGMEEKPLQAAIGAAASSAPVIAGQFEGGVLNLSAQGDIGAAEIYLVSFTPVEQMEIRGGDNAGNVFDYVNIVRDITSIGEWTDAPIDLATPKDELSHAVIVQAAGMGPILFAALIE